VLLDQTQLNKKPLSRHNKPAFLQNKRGEERRGEERRGERPMLHQTKAVFLQKSPKNEP